MTIGIVGSEGAKFTPETEELARQIIREEMKYYTEVVSGGCHLGGIDIWAVEEAAKAGKDFIEYLPVHRSWDGYKARNIQIAERAHRVICITVKTLPPGFNRKGWEDFCYHCKTNTHIKSGGCWTVKYAKALGKDTQVIVVGG